MTNEQERKKAWLSQANDTLHLLKTLEEEQELYLENACITTGNMSIIKVQESNTNKAEDRFIKYADELKKNQDQQTKIRKLRSEVQSKIYMINNAKLQDILIARHLNDRKPQEIADEWNYSIERINQLYLQALNEFEI